MRKKSLLVLAVAAFFPVFSASAQVIGGRVGAPASPASGNLNAPPAPAKPLGIAIPPRQVFPAVAADPVERPAFATKPHAITRSIATATAMMVREERDGGMLGVTSDVIAIVPGDSRQGNASSAVFVSKQAQVGPEMNTSFNEAVRAVKLRYPRWEAGKIEFSFGEKYTPHEGGSAGTCFGVLLLSALEGFDVDPKFAITGDLNANWKVVKIGGVTAKVRGAAADGCLYAAVPQENVAQLSDMALMYGEGSLRDIQIFSIVTLQDAVALLRTDRAPQTQESIKEFADLQPKLKAAGRQGLGAPDVQKALEQIIAYAPNHESAKALLAIGRGTAPKTLSTTFSLYQIMVITYPYRHIIIGDEQPTRATVTTAMTTAARKSLGQVALITPPEIQPLLRDARSIIETSESLAAMSPADRARVNPVGFFQKRESFVKDYEALGSNKELIEKMIREGLQIAGPLSPASHIFVMPAFANGDRYARILATAV